jgi:hypothetical protein
MGKTSFLAYADDRLTGFVPLTAADPSVPSSNAGGSWTRRIDTRREWRAFRDYYEEYLPRAMPPSAPPTICRGPISYKGLAPLQRDLETFKTALRGVNVQEAFVPAIAPAMVGRGQNQHYKTEEEYVFAIAEALRVEYKAIVDAGLHPPDRRSRARRDVGHDDPGAAARGVPPNPGAEHRRAQSRARRHSGGPRALPPLLGQLARPARPRPRPARRHRPHAAGQGTGLLGRGGDAPALVRVASCGKT